MHIQNCHNLFHWLISKWKQACDTKCPRPDLFNLMLSVTHFINLSRKRGGLWYVQIVHLVSSHLTDPLLPLYSLSLCVSVTELHICIITVRSRSHRDHTTHVARRFTVRIFSKLYVWYVFKITQSCGGRSHSTNFLTINWNNETRWIFTWR